MTFHLVSFLCKVQIIQGSLGDPRALFEQSDQPPDSVLTVFGRSGEKGVVQLDTKND